MLKLEKICKSYQRTNPLPVLKNIDLCLGKGRNIAVCGPSGSGKSTLLKIMGTLESPDSGTLSLNQQEYASLNDNQKALIRNQEIGFIFQNHYLMPHCTALENVLLPTLAYKNNSTQIIQKATDILEKIGMIDRKDHLPGEMSGGECQRIAVARAIINSPTLILADEPTGALDQEMAHEIIELLIRVQNDLGATMVLVTHANEYAERMQSQVKLRLGSLVV